MADEQKVKAPSITRNNIVLELTEMVFGKKSDNAGKKFFAPCISITDFDKYKDWIGVDSIVSVVNKWMRNAFAGIYLDNVDEKTGLLNEAAWQADAADFTAGVTKLSDLEEEIYELSELQSNYAMDPNFGAVGDDGTPTAEADQLKTAITAVALKLKPLRLQKASIEAKYAQRVALRKSKEEAAKNKTLSGQGVVSVGGQTAPATANT